VGRWIRVAGGNVTRVTFLPLFLRLSKILIRNIDSRRCGSCASNPTTHRLKMCVVRETRDGRVFAPICHSIIKFFACFCRHPIHAPCSSAVLFLNCAGDIYCCGSPGWRFSRAYFMQNDFRLLSLFHRCGCSASEVMRTDFELLIAAL